MVNIEHQDNIVFITATGKLHTEDYNRMLPILRQKAKEYDRIRWYFRMEDFGGWSMNAFWRDVQFDIRNEGNLEKIAMVGENKWQEVMTDFMKIFTDAEIRYFPVEKDDEAREWISS